MKVKLSELIRINEGLIEILEKELPVKPSYWLSRFAVKVGSEFSVFEKARISLLVKHAKKDNNGKPLFTKDKAGNDTQFYDVADMKAFEKEFIELTEEEVDIPFEPIKLERLGDIVLKPVVLAKLEKIIVE